MCLQGEEHSTQAVSRLPGGTGYSAGVGQWGTTAADHQPGGQLCLRPVSCYTQDNVLHVFTTGLWLYTSVVG